jgi:hypothetical protein
MNITDHANNVKMLENKRINKVNLNVFGGAAEQEGSSASTLDQAKKVVWLPRTTLMGSPPIQYSRNMNPSKLLISLLGSMQPAD